MCKNCSLGIQVWNFPCLSQILPSCHCVDCWVSMEQAQGHIALSASRVCASSVISSHTWWIMCVWVHVRGQVNIWDGVVSVGCSSSSSRSRMECSTMLMCSFVSALLRECRLWHVIPESSLVHHISMLSTSFLQFSLVFHCWLAQRRENQFYSFDAGFFITCYRFPVGTLGASSILQVYLFGHADQTVLEQLQMISHRKWQSQAILIKSQESGKFFTFFSSGTLALFCDFSKFL